jgi:carbamoyl-phosphate synthase large subunit
MIIGSGPIVIGQAAEFDFSGSQACRSLKEEGYKTVLVNSNPATIQTDINMADSIYIEPLMPEIVAKIIEKERPDGILSGMGGQTALNICTELAERGILEKYKVELLGTQLKAIATSEDRDLFRKLMMKIDEPIPRSLACNSIDEAKMAVEQVGGFPVLIRPAYTLGGTGGGIANDPQELEDIVGRGLVYSRIKQVLIEESVLGWKEYEYEVMRDGNNNCITVCNMENFDGMGVHTGESIVIAPAQTLSDRDHQLLRTAALKIIRALEIEGGCNIQFAFNHDTGEYRVIEVNPRVSRSSALASKATGYPIARVAAKIALGMTLDEIPNNVTGKTYASFEPTLDYVVIKIPRWPFDKFLSVNRNLGTQMKSTGEVMAIGRNVEEALLKAIRSLDIDKFGLESVEELKDYELIKELQVPTEKRLFVVAEALRRGYGVDKISELSTYDKFFISKLENILNLEKEVLKFKNKPAHLPRGLLKTLKQTGFSDSYIAELVGCTEFKIRKLRAKYKIAPTYKMVDTCGGEFEAATPYYYSTYETPIENVPRSKSTDRVKSHKSTVKKVLIIGSGPIRIGQGIEFDYSCVHAVIALKEQGIKALIINNNPETVSTDFDISDALYFEPLTLEDVLNLIEKELPDGVIVQFGGQTSINLANKLEKALAKSKLPTKILGTSPRNINVAEDREQFSNLMSKLGIPQPDAGTGYSFEQVREIAERIEYPVLVRPSYVLGGRAMEIVYNEKDLEYYMSHAVKASKDHPVLVDKFLSDAVELDVDAVVDGKDVFIGGIMEHIEEAGIHSGDSYCVIPPQTLSPKLLKQVKDTTIKIAKALKIKGLLNIQYAVKDNVVYILEANPRASRTIPFVSKSIGVPLAKLATRVMLGEKLNRLGYIGEKKVSHVSIKSPIFPFQKLAGLDTILTPEMKSTGEGMGIDTSFGMAYYKARLSDNSKFLVNGEEGVAYLTVGDKDKPKMLWFADQLNKLGIKLVATKGTASYLREHDIPVKTIWRISEHQSPDAIELMRKGEIRLILNTPTQETGARRDGYMMRRLAVDLEIPFITTISSAKAVIEAIKSARSGDLRVQSLNDYHK